MGPECKICFFFFSYNWFLDFDKNLVTLPFFCLHFRCNIHIFPFPLWSFCCALFSNVLSVFSDQSFLDRTNSTCMLFPPTCFCKLREFYCLFSMVLICIEDMNSEIFVRCSRCSLTDKRVSHIRRIRQVQGWTGSRWGMWIGLCWGGFWSEASFRRERFHQRLNFPSSEQYWNFYNLHLFMPLF